MKQSDPVGVPIPLQHKEYSKIFHLIDKDKRNGTGTG